MAVVGINNLPELKDVLLSDNFEVYNLSGNFYVQSDITFADLSSLFYSYDTFTQLSAKYVELIQLMSSFRKFIKDNYFTAEELSGILTTASHLSSVIDQLQTTDKVRREFLEDYATLEYANLKKAEAYANHEKMAVDNGSLRASILQSIDVFDSNN